MALPAELEVSLREAWDAATRAHPGLALPPDELAAALVEALGPARGDAPGLSGVRVPDLYLARALARDEARALTVFEERWAPRLREQLAALRLPRGELDEVLQSVRIDLFWSQAGRPPRIATYLGRGDLEGWLRVTATRAGLKILRARRTDREEAEALLDLPDDEASAELRALRRKAGEHFRAAFTEAMAALPPRERNLLRYHYLDGLSLDQIAHLHRVHRATGARWLARARESVLARTQDALRARLRLSEGEARSLIRAVQSHLDLTFSRLLPQALEE